MALGASIRGDGLGKIMMFLFIMLVPILFLHFFVVFLKEKQDYQLSIKLLKKMYTVVTAGIALISQITYFWPSPLTYNIYRFNSIFCIVYFLFGFLLALSILSKLYLKYRKEQSYISTMIKTVWASIFVSFTPIVCFSFIPNYLYGYGWMNSLYAGIFVFFFPITLAYLVVTTKLYDIDVVLRRVLLTALIATVPSGIFVVMIKVLFPAEAAFARLLMMFVLFVAILTLVLYSLENMFAKLEPILFPRKYYLQSALKKSLKILVPSRAFGNLKILFWWISSILCRYLGERLFFNIRIPWKSLKKEILMSQKLRAT